MQPQYRRLFIGIPLSHPLTKRLGREASQWPEEATLVTRGENLHLLLHHFGFILEEDIYSVSEKLREALGDKEAFDIHFDTIMLHESEENPKEIWLSGGESEELLDLKKTIDTLFTHKTHELRSFRPHVILAKLKKNRWLKLTPAPQIAKEVNFAEPVDKGVLYESLTIDGKRTYEAVDTFPLV